MTKIVMGKKKDAFPGRKGTSWSRTSLVREGIGSSPSCPRVCVPYIRRTLPRSKESCGATLPQCGIMSVALICQLAPARPRASSDFHRLKRES